MSLAIAAAPYRAPRARKRVLLLAAVVVAALVALLVSPRTAYGAERSGSAGSSAGTPTPQTCYPVWSYFVDRYNEDPGHWGCAVSNPFASAGGGTQQNFTNGNMVLSPSAQGADLVLSILRYSASTGLVIYYQAGVSNPFTYSDWLARIAVNGSTLPQSDCFANSAAADGYCTSTYAGIVITPASGTYTISVEGCDYSEWSGHTCHQGWTIPLSMYA